MNEFKLTGIVQQIDEPQVISDKLTKRQIVLTVGDKYPEPIAIEAINDRCDLLDTVSVGQEITAFVNVRGKAWKDRFFTTLALWKIEAAGGAQPPAKSDFASANKNPSLRQQPGAQIADPSDEMPF